MQNIEDGWKINKRSPGAPVINALQHKSEEVASVNADPPEKRSTNNLGNLIRSISIIEYYKRGAPTFRN